MHPGDAAAYAAFAAARLGLALTDDELTHAAERALAKQDDLAPLHAAARAAPVEGALTFRPADGAVLDPTRTPTDG